MNGWIWIGIDGGGVNSFDFVIEEFCYDCFIWGDKVVLIIGFIWEFIFLLVFFRGLFVYNKENGKWKLLFIDYFDFK